MTCNHNVIVVTLERIFNTEQTRDIQPNDYMETAKYVTGQPVFHHEKTTERKKKAFFTAKQPDKPCELVLAEPSSACKQLRLTTYNCKNIRTCSPILLSYKNQLISY